MTPKTFTEAPIWQEASLKPREGQRFFVRHRKNEDRPGNYIEVVWEGTETSGGYRHAILLTQTGERLVWEFNDVCYRTHRQIKAAETITLPVELNPAQIKAAISALPVNDHSPEYNTIAVQTIWSAIKQHGGK